jgi:hypothetical protein
VVARWRYALGQLQSTPSPGDAAHRYRSELRGLAEPSGLEAGFTAAELARGNRRSPAIRTELTGRSGR